MPADQMPADLEGKWFDLSTVKVRFGPTATDVASASPTGRFEVRDDGAVAEVWELRWKVGG